MADWWANDAAVGGTATAGNWWEKDKSASAEYDAIYQEIGARVDPADYGPMKDVLTQDEFGNVQADPAQYEQLAPEQRSAVNEVTVAANQGAGSLQQGYEKFFTDAADPESPDNFMYGKVKDQASTRASFQAIAGLGQQIKETYQRFTGDGEDANATNRAGEAMRGSLDELAGGSDMERNVRGATESTLKSLYAGRAGGLPGIIAWATQGAYNDAKTEAVDSGMSESEATKYALGQGAIEGGVTALFQMMGFGGTEKLLSGNAKWQGVKSFVAGLFGEQAEEQTIAFAQMALEKLGDVDKTDLTPEQAVQVASDTMIQTALGFGMAQGISTATQFVEKPTVRNAKAAGVDQFAKTAKERRDLVKAVKSQITTLSVTTNGAQNDVDVTQETQDSAPPTITPFTEENSESPSETSDLGAAADRAEQRPGPTTPEGPVQMAAGIPISKATARWFKQNFTSGGEANKPILDAAFRRDGRIRGHVKQASQNSVDLQKAVRKEFKIPFLQQIPDTVSTQLNEALRDPAMMATLPQSVAVPLTQMRDHIDGISQVVASLPGISADLQLTIQQNLGKYVTRTYKKFGQNPQAWMDKALADPQIMTNFAAEVRTSSPNATDDEIYQLAQILLQRNTASLGDIGFPAGAATKKYTDVLKKRKDLSPAIRQLYGERTDAFENYAETIGKLASLTAHRQFADEVLQTGLQQGFISPVDTPAPGHTKEVNHQQIKQLAPLAGHVMPVELADALNTAYTVSKPGWSARQLLKLSGAAKASATVLSWQATIRNLTGNVPIALANGAFDPADFARSAKTIWWQDMLNKGDAAAKAEIADLNRLGLMEDTSVSELNSMAKDVSDSVQDYIAGINPTDHWKRATRGVGRFYQSMDSVWKVHTFYNYLPKYAAANPQMSEPELREHVAKIVREITPTYSEASKAAKFASRYFPLGPFAMFSAEMWRTTANRVRLSIEEIKSGNPALAKIGYQRMAGQAAALGGMTALAMTIKAALGVSDDDEEAIRQRVAPWQRNAILIPQSVDKKTGKVEFFDASYNDPFSIFSEPAMAVWRGEPEEATGALAEPFVSEDIAYGVIVSLLRGTDENNRPIYDPGLSPTEQNVQIAKYVAGKFMPGTLRSAERIRKGLMEETSPSGRQYGAGNEALSAIAGVKLDTMDRAQSDYYRNREFNGRVQDSGSAIRRAFLQRGTVDLGTLEETYKSADAARRKAMKEWREYVDGSIQLGEENPYAKVVSDVGAESEIVKSMYTGKYVPYQFRPQDLRKMMALPGGQERVDLWMRLNAEAQQPSESTVGSE